MILGPKKWKSTALVCTRCTFRKERAAGMVPAFTLLQKKSQVHFAGASNATFRSHQDQPKIRKLSFYITHKVTKAFSVTVCACGFSIGVALSVLEKELSFSYVCSVPVSQLKCKPCVGDHAFVLVHDTEQGGRRC